MENEEKRMVVDSVPLILIILILQHIVIPLLVLHLKARLIISNILITPSSILDNDIIPLNGNFIPYNLYDKHLYQISYRKLQDNSISNNTYKTKFLEISRIFFDTNEKMITKRK